MSATADFVSTTPSSLEEITTPKMTEALHGEPDCVIASRLDPEGYGVVLMHMHATDGPCPLNEFTDLAGTLRLGPT